VIVLLEATRERKIWREGYPRDTGNVVTFLFVFLFFENRRRNWEQGKGCQPPGDRNLTGKGGFQGRREAGLQVVNLTHD